ncbi:MAG: polysaccharide biosynthesis tyrosine autokinase [Acidimicrobiales bacterium]
MVVFQALLLYRCDIVSPMQTLDAGRSVEYGLLDYLAIARRRWLWMATAILAFGSLSAAWTLTRPPAYSSVARVLLADTASREALDPSSQNPVFLSRELSNEISLAYSDEVEASVRDELGDLPDVAITADTDADVLEFTARAVTADEAAAFANTWANKYIEAKRAAAVDDISAAAASLQTRLQELRQQRQQIRAPLDELSDQIAETENQREVALLQQQYNRLAEDLSYELQLVANESEATVNSLSELKLRSELAAVGEARVVQVAAPPQGTINAPLSRNLALGIVLGVLVGFGLALMAETRDTTISSPADVQKVTDLPVLASVPEAKKTEQARLDLATHVDAEGPHANAYHKVRSSLGFLSMEGDLRSILITSARANEGKTTSACNLALAFALIGKRTVLVDVDFRRGRVHKVFGIGQTPGLSDVILHGLPIRRAVCRIGEADLSNLLVLPTGTVPPSPAAFVGTTGFLDAVSWLREQSEVVILDSPPLLAVSDPHTMAKHVDGVVITVRAGSTSTRELAETIERCASWVPAPAGHLILSGVDETDG